MATTMQLSDLMVAVRQRADMTPASYSPSVSGGNSGLFVTDAELVSYINQSYFELYDLLVSKYGDNYFVKTPPQSITTDGTNDQYALATDFLKLLGVDLQLSAAQNSWITLKPFAFQARNRNGLPNLQALRGAGNLRYRVHGPNLWLTPLPAGGQTLQVWYVPRMTPLAALSDTVDGISGWTEYIIVDAAVKCLQKEESDVSVLLAQKAALVKRIEAAAENRDAGSPAKVVDAQENDWCGPFGGFPGDGWGY